MPQVLTTNALILCPHGGRGISSPLHKKWTANGGSVLVEGDPGTLLCPFVPLPCVGYKLQSMGLNATQIDGQKVILVTDFNQTFTGLPLVMAEFHQTFDQSTPAPIPTGQSAPPASPEMADLVAPVITTSTSNIPVALTPPPPPLAVSFNMATDHPLKWILTLINEPLKYHLDLTNGAPGATVMPPGGNWSTPALTILVSMTTAFLTALTVGKHHLYLTGVSRRGLSGHSEVVLEVTP